MIGLALVLAATAGLILAGLTVLLIAGGIRYVRESGAALLAWGVAVACTFLSLGILIGAPA